jgi:hypothetical protein
MKKNFCVKIIVCLLFVSLFSFSSSLESCDNVKPCNYWCEGSEICAETEAECDDNPYCKYECIYIKCNLNLDRTISEKYDVTKRVPNPNLETIEIVSEKNIKKIFSEKILKTIFPGYNFFKNFF